MNNKQLGIILSFYLKESGEDTKQQEEYPFLSWSPYDRVDIEVADKFEDFFNSQYRVRWNGVVQQMHLIPEYPSEFLWDIQKRGEEASKILIRRDDNNEGNKKEFGLNCIVTTRFSD